MGVGGIAARGEIGPQIACGAVCAPAKPEEIVRRARAASWLAAAAMARGRGQPRHDAPGSTIGPERRSSRGQGEIAVCGVPGSAPRAPTLANDHEARREPRRACSLADRDGGRGGLCGQLNSATAGHRFSPAPAASIAALL